MDNAFTRTYELGRTLGGSLERHRIIALLRAIADKTEDKEHQEVILLMVKAIGETSAE